MLRVIYGCSQCPSSLVIETERDSERDGEREFERSILAVFSKFPRLGTGGDSFRLRIVPSAFFHRLRTFA